MTRRLVVAAVACSLVLAGCLGGSAGTPDSPTGTTQTTTATATETTAVTTTVETTDTVTMQTTDSTTSAEPPGRSTYGTYESLAANASFPVPEPNVSEPFAFESGVIVKLADGESVAMAYHETENGSLENVLSIRKAENESQYDLTAGNATTLGDRDARYVAAEDGGTFLWECDGYVYRVSVQQYTDEFGESGLREVAESIGCE